MDLLSTYHELNYGIEFSGSRMSILQLFRNGAIRPLALKDFEMEEP